MIVFGEETASNYERSKRLEWVLTNGLGGYASSTIIGANTRAYHGLLVASLKPPMGRMLLLSKLEEEVEIDGTKFALSVNKYRGAIHPQGHRCLREFRLEHFPTFTYAVGDAVVEKKVFMRHGENTTVVSYTVRKAPEELSLSIYPLLNCREPGARTREESSWTFDQTPEDKGVEIRPFGGAPLIFLLSDKASYSPTCHWYRNFIYDLELERGYPAEEDAYNPGVFTAKLDQGRQLLVAASDRHRETNDILNVERDELIRHHMLLSKIATSDEFLSTLVEAADKFVVARSDGRTVVAGYHWFGDWGRDALISIPGLTLVTGRFQDARSILSTSLRYVDHGLVPAFFIDDEPRYASADTSLWLFYTVQKYIEYSGDLPFAKTVFERLESVIEAHIRGTMGVRMAEDGLIDARIHNVPLTWMDAVVDGKPVTPRVGKAVEVNALWYNALKVMERLAGSFEMDEKRERYREMAEMTRESFNEKYWDTSGRYLYDCIDGENLDSSIRPNQIFSISLPFEALFRDRWDGVLKCVREHLLTPYGLRTLSPSDWRYHGRYLGDQRSRDEAYHQGTVWPWLIGPFVTAYIKCYGRTVQAMSEARSLLEPFRGHLAEAGLGVISEVFDGDPPHRPGGCVAQAWSVAEILRCYLEDISHSNYYQANMIPNRER
jgi:predicted glycogen debranching enzyme